MILNQVKFSGEGKDDFYATLHKRVNEYFSSNNISRFANASMVVKTVFMLALYLVPYFLMLLIFENAWWALLMWTLMGFGMAGVGLSIMHDANHHAYSKHRIVNVILGYLLNAVGGNSINWRIQHNVLHHTYTNVDGMDEDINPGKIMRFSPNQKRYKIHRFQHYYASFFYGLMTLAWFISKDYKQIHRYNKMGLLKSQNTSLGRELGVLILSKMIYAFVFIALPLWLAPTAWYVSIIGFVLMQFISGLVLALIFQPAHVIPESTFPVPNVEGTVETRWAANQLLNTANFAPKARLLSWYVGGLNYQVEHHLFPNICHVHYKNLSKIVRDTAIEFNLPYYQYKTFGAAVREHFKLLRDLGRNDQAKPLHH